MKTIDLSGIWQLVPDERKELTGPTGEAIPVRLPGTTSAAGIGPENTARETGFLTDSHPFAGWAWFSRTFTAEGWQGQQVLLTLERTRQTAVYVDGIPVGTENSLSTPHRYLLPELTDGEHLLTVRVDNTDYPTRGGHLTSPDTQSNWNGITGEISLTVGRTLLTGIRVRPDEDLRGIHVTADVLGPARGTLSLQADGLEPQTVNFDGGVLDCDLALPAGLSVWDEYTPDLHTLSLRAGEDCFRVTFGLRRFRARGRALFCNDREVFLRGRTDCLLFPLTGFAPTDAASWRALLQTAKAYGINHYRYHSSCPPDAAFTAADELGFFFEPELPFWGTVAESDGPESDTDEQKYLIREGFRMLREFGHHPSFVMLSMGNELWGSKSVLNRMMADYRAYDPDKLYISGSNNFQFAPDILDEDVFVGVRFSTDRLIRGSYATCDGPQGRVQCSEPESVSSYDEMILPTGGDPSGVSGKVLIQYETGVKEVDAQASGGLTARVPVLSHEVGQYVFYPDFREIDRYTGPLKARNFEVFRDRLRAAGLWDDHSRFFRSAGRLAADCYRREIETFLRTRELAGFQLLDIQDFSGQGTALVGVLNAFMESKGLITPEEWRRFCSGTVILGEFSRFVLCDGEELSFSVQISECDPRKRHDTVTCALIEDGKTVLETTVPVGARRGRLTEPVHVSPGTVRAGKARTVTVRLTLEDGTMTEYPLWIFPDSPVRITPEGITDGTRSVRFVRDAAEAKACGTPVLVIPDARDRLPAEYCTDFWCYSMFRSISESMHKPVPTGTLGLCIDAGHPALRDFAADEYTTPPWYHILAHAHCEPLDPAIRPAVQMIDNTERCSRLGILYEDHGIPFLTARLWEAADRPEVRVFAGSLLNWLSDGHRD